MNVVAETVGVHAVEQALRSGGLEAAWSAGSAWLGAALEARGGQFVWSTVKMSFVFAAAQLLLMEAVGPALGGRGDRASVSYVAANLFKGGVLCAMAAQRNNWDMMVGLATGRGAPDGALVLWNATVYASLDLSALLVNGAMRMRTVLHHVFVVIVATCIAELGPDAPVSQAATLYAFWSGAAACVNVVMAASKAAQVHGSRLPPSLFAMTLGVYAVAFACNMASLAAVASRAVAADLLPLHHALPAAAIVCVWAYDDAALMRWLAKMAAATPSKPRVDLCDSDSDDGPETPSDHGPAPDGTDTDTED